MWFEDPGPHHTAPKTAPQYYTNRKLHRRPQILRAHRSAECTLYRIAVAMRNYTAVTKIISRTFSNVKVKIR